MDKVFALNHNVDQFNLFTDTGKKFNSKIFSNFPSVIFFGFLNCPDVCPTTLTNISQVIEKLGEDKNKVKFYFVTVDPERDNINNIRGYLDIFNNQIIGVTGNPEDIGNFLKYMYVFSEKVYLSENEYTVDHSSNVFLFNKNGSFFGTLSLSEKDKIILEKMKKLIIGA